MNVMVSESSTACIKSSNDTENVVGPYIHTDIASMLWDAQQAVKKFVTLHPSLGPTESSGSNENDSHAGSPILFNIHDRASKCSSEEERNDDYELISLLYSQTVKIQAPMVRCSRPAFRKLCRLWGTDVSYTAMIMAESVAHSAAARDAEFSMYQNENRLIVQLASSGGPDAALAAVYLQPYCDAIDLNCGCPQKWALREGIGAAMLQKPEQVADVVHCIRNALSNSPLIPSSSHSSTHLPIPCVVKMRVEEDIRKSVDFSRQCVAAGASWLTIHGRTPQCSSHAPVRWSDIQLIREILEKEGVPVVANGNVVDGPSALQISMACGTGGVMSANGLLDNPAAFALRQDRKGAYFYSSSSSSLSFPPDPSTTLESLSFFPSSYNSLYTSDSLFGGSIPLGYPFFKSFHTAASSLIFSSPPFPVLRWPTPPPPPREVLSDFLRLAVDMDLPFTTSIQHFLRMARWYLSPSERSYMSTLRSNLALLLAVEECGLYTSRGRYQPFASRGPLL